MAKTLIIIGIILVVLGLCWPLLQKLQLGRLPGDFVFKFGNFTFYFPLTTRGSGVRLDFRTFSS